MMTGEFEMGLSSLPDTPGREPITYASAYRKTATLLSQAGISNARNEAYWLLEGALGVSRLDIAISPDGIIDPAHWVEAVEDVSRRAKGEPLQYILGTQMFRGLAIHVQPGVLIPRPESELILEEVHQLVSSHQQWHMADVGAGSGCLSVALAKEFPASFIHATDCSAMAIEVAQSNARRYGVSDRLSWYVGDVLEPFREGTEFLEKFSIIVSNPPYIPTHQLATLQRDVRDFEPRLALDGGMDGLCVSRRLLNDSLDYLQRGGHLVLEMGEGQASQICEEARRHGRWHIQNIRQDEAGIDRVISLQRKQ